MMKHGMVHETMAELAPTQTIAPLPPLNNLPQWSRVNTLDKARYPKPFLKDRLQPLSDPAPGEEEVVATSNGASDVEIVNNTNPTQRIVHLEKSLDFLRRQHHEVLANLHEEIDMLKRENKELQFQIVMMQNSPQTPAMSAKRGRHKATRERGGSSSSGLTDDKGPPVTRIDLTDPLQDQQSQVSDEKMEEMKVVFLEEEIKELKSSLRDEKCKNHYLTNLIGMAEQQKTQKQPKPVSASPIVGSRTSPREVLERHKASSAVSGRQINGHQGAALTIMEPLPFNATVEPLLVHVGSQSRPPTLQETQVIMKHLQRVGEKQAHELSRLKTDLRDVLYSHKWSPDAYLLAKAYVAEDEEREAAEHSRLPKIALRQPSRKLPEMAYMPRDMISLPALKQTMGNKAVERRKRTQILQKARLRREVLQ